MAVLCPGLPLTNVTPNEQLTLANIGGGHGWWSDYDYFTFGTNVSATSFSGTVSADMMSYTAVADF
jgi:hypothetical protein